VLHKDAQNTLRRKLNIRLQKKLEQKPGIYNGITGYRLYGNCIPGKWSVTGKSVNKTFFHIINIKNRGY
jgi:hypothetical protein